MSNKSKEEVIKEFNKLSLEFSQSGHEVNDECSNLGMESAPGKSIRLRWDSWTGPAFGWTERHNYISVEEAIEELKKLKKQLGDNKNEN